MFNDEIERNSFDIIVDYMRNYKTTDEQRIEILNALIEGYCKRCGSEIYESYPCVCCRDE